MPTSCELDAESTQGTYNPALRIAPGDGDRNRKDRFEPRFEDRTEFPESFRTEFPEPARGSTDGGQSFGTIRTIGTANLPTNDTDCDLDGVDDTLVLNGDIRESTFANLAADPLNSSNVYAAWNHFTSGSSEISFSRSTDGGTTWSTPVRINDTVTRDQFSPRIATTIWFGADPDSTIVNVSWYDRRNDANNLNFDLYADGSSTLGASWTTDSRWTDTTSSLPDIHPGQDCEPSPCYLGDYNGMFSLNPGADVVVSTWCDSRLTATGSAGTCPDGRSYPASRPDLDIRAAVGC